MASFEGRIDPLSTFKSGDEPARLAAERVDWTCAIDNGAGTFGTGILINHDLVLTNYHVIRNLLAEPTRYTNASCRFDYKRDSYTNEVSQGRRVGFSENWSVIWSRYSDKDEEGAASGFESDRLDYAIIRLSESVGHQPVGVSSRENGMPARRWLTLPVDPDVPKPGSNIVIWQHPINQVNGSTALEVMPQQHSTGVVLAVLDGDLRLRHAATTFSGSSGAGCFNVNYDFVALHHASDPNVDQNSIGKWNQAIPISAIVRHLKANGFGQLVGAAPPPPSSPPRYAGIDRGQQFADVIERRVRAAAILMDRDAVEDRISWSRDKQNPNRGIVHVFACRHIDSHRNFIERLVRLSLVSRNEALEKRQRRMAAFLGAKSNSADNEEPWLRENLTWQPADVPADLALAMMTRDLTAIARSKRHVVVEAAVPIQNIKLSRERKLVPALAQLCAKLGNADRLQVFVVYYDRNATVGADKTIALRNELGTLWSPKNRPNGGGICLNFEDIGSIDMESWCRALQTTWQMEEGQLRGDMEIALGDDRLPMLDAEKRLAPILRRYLAGLT